MSYEIDDAGRSKKVSGSYSSYLHNQIYCRFPSVELLLMKIGFPVSFQRTNEGSNCFLICHTYHSNTAGARRESQG
jgi:hypothetical protein